jgi:hypothetical protein
MGPGIRRFAIRSLVVGSVIAGDGVVVACGGRVYGNAGPDAMAGDEAGSASSGSSGGSGSGSGNSSGSGSSSSSSSSSSGGSSSGALTCPPMLTQALTCIDPADAASCPTFMLALPDGGNDAGQADSGLSCSVMSGQCVCSETVMQSGYTTTVTIEYTSATMLSVETNTTGPDGGVVAACEYSCM